MFKLYNTLSRKKESFKPLKNKAVNIYTCGPTVYDFAHLGNLRTYIWEDVLRRTLKYNGYKVKQVMNITDVEDKIIKRALKENKSIDKITKQFTKTFFDDLKKLNIEKVEFYPRATTHIKEMVDLIGKLLEKKYAYRGNDGSVYFNISKFKNYGKLSRLQKRKIKIGARISVDEYNKKQAQDFVLWKTQSADSRGQDADKRVIEPAWPSPWGAGRPGWHIECSAMSLKYLTDIFDHQLKIRMNPRSNPRESAPLIDIHAGGVDLIFPHHENEIAQSEAASGKKFARFWIHGEHLLVDNQKMAKSLGNFYTLRDLKKRGFNPLAFRYLVLTSHYRSKLNFTWKSLEAAQNALNNLYNEYRSILRTSDALNRTSDIQKLKYEKKFLAAVNDDLNTPQAMSIIWQIISAKGGRGDQLSNWAKKQLLFKFDRVLGFNLNEVKSVKIPLKVKQLVAQREKLRINKQFIPADRLRKKIEKLGYKVEDTPYGPKTSPARH